MEINKKINFKIKEISKFCNEILKKLRYKKLQKIFKKFWFPIKKISLLQKTCLNPLTWMVRMLQQKN